METLREYREEYRDYEEILKQFRTSVCNEHELSRFEVTNQYDTMPKENWYEAEIYLYRNYQVELSDLVKILDILNLPITSFSITSKLDEVDNYKYQYIEYIDLWDILSRRNDFDFLVVMVHLSQIDLHQPCLKELQNIVKKTLKNKGIKVPNFTPTVFVAMSFDESMTEARKVISKAIETEGYTPLLIDSKEHNNQIVPEIFNEIDKSKFVIADLTHHKTGVYYEAGYAKGKGKDVIFTCRKDDFEKRHFDVAQTNTIVWETEDELMLRLLKRIEAMLLQSV